MIRLRQALLGIFIALASIGLILGGFSLSLAEENGITQPTATQTLMPTLSPTLPPLTVATDSPTVSPSLTSTLAFTFTPTWTSSMSPSPTNCPPRAGWISYIVQSGDTLPKIATRYRSSVAELQQANCLLTVEVLPGMLIYVPPLPTQTPISCGRPSGWVVYIVQPGDTLYRLSVAFGIGVGDLQQANCMGNSTLLRVGQTLYVPPWATRTPSPTFLVFPTYTPIPTNTPEYGLDTDTPTEFPTSEPTEPPVPTATEIPIVIPTDTLVPTGQ
jgi:LysM repeat protein